MTKSRAAMTKNRAAMAKSRAAMAKSSKTEHWKRPKVSH
jgi:hypothetical protein